ncbi:acylphosphatase [Metabacillus sp. GX 13764]|uniref:acylphosphatase n=1 Tax=Metabacillus kandeliae TaxID=2900151 RepID=UPI001E3FD9F7|nr:acylphosphatase [Metabacillus kandeliae]MCD7036499.1 acylphosphatase [Metabacillus kandeliae]
MHKHILVKGRVQGVGFRYFVQTKAAQQNIKGWVKNLQDGNVEIEAEGSEKDLELFTEEIRKGSPFSHVDSLETAEKETLKEYSSFDIVY